MTDHDIDLSAAVEAGARLLFVMQHRVSEKDYDKASYASLSDAAKREATNCISAALPHILAQVEARVKPAREDLIATLKREFGSVLAHDPYNPARFWGLSADAVLALFNGKTEQEVRAEVAAEMDRLLESEWQSGWRAGYRDSERGSICGRRQAANEGRARGGEW